MSEQPKLRLLDLVGYRVVGRHGVLGRVVEVDAATGAQEGTIRVRGGVSDGLLYHVPTQLLQAISRRNRVITIDVDVVDFVPRLGEDGIVELNVSP